MVESGLIELGKILTRADSHRLVDCPYFKRILFSRERSPDVVHLWNLCSLDKRHCDFHGCRLKFKPCFAGVRVVWICPKTIGLPNMEDFHGV
jgi:hypothetical protein